jgi:Uma2 family endonuclease
MTSNAYQLLEEARPVHPVRTLQQYLEEEEARDEKHEYAGGVVIAMAGATETHELISINLVLSLGNHLRGKPCRVYKSDLKVRVQLLDKTYFYYPDVMVACDPDDNASPLWKDRPLLLIEVVSSRSEERDTETKVFAYLSIASLRSYLIVWQNKRAVTHYHRTSTGIASTHYPEAGEAIPLPELNLTLTMDEIYERVPMA